MRRRAFLASVGLLAGCPARRDGDGSPAAEPTVTATPAGPPVAPQRVVVENAAERDRFATVVVERDGRTFFSASASLFAGGREVFTDVVSRGGSYDLIVETAGGDRLTDAWTVDDTVDGLSVVLDGDGVDAWRTARCTPDCAAARGGEGVDLPLVGDGQGRWYSAGDVVLRNPTAGPRTARLELLLDGERLLDYRYRVPARCDLVIPATFRSGIYEVRVEAGGETVSERWHVPEEPRQYVRLSTPLSTTCGPASTVLVLENFDDEPHRIDVTVARDGESVFGARHDLAADGRQVVRPAVDPGLHRVRVAVDGTTTISGDWWTCSRHGLAFVFVDATGDVTFRQSRPEPG
jgi:hypothetical protein